MDNSLVYILSQDMRGNFSLSSCLLSRNGAFLEHIVDKQQTLQVPVSVARGLSWLRCNKVFSRMDSLKRHMKIHAQRKEFQCTTCIKTFYR